MNNKLVSEDKIYTMEQIKNLMTIGRLYNFLICSNQRQEKWYKTQHQNEDAKAKNSHEIMC